MEIIALSLINFRNFHAKKIDFDARLTVIIGPNGSGKSNILEAISLLCAVRPVHIESDADLVKFGKSEAKIECRVKPPEASLVSDGGLDSRETLTINFQVVDELHIKKSFIIDDLKKRFIDLAAHLAVVIFHPQDLDLVAGSPSLRRHHLDSFLASLDRDYWRNMSAYNKVVVRRNKVLQRIFEGKSKPMELGFWDSRLLEHGSYISKRRGEFFEFLNSNSSKEKTGETVAPSKQKARLSGKMPLRLKPLSGRRLDLRLGLGVSSRGIEFSGISWQLKQSLLTEEKLMRNRERDISARVTLSGPHRDDFRFLFGGLWPRVASGPEGCDLAYFGSRGEQRMAVLALKLFELEYFQKKKGVRPILALDDIFSELDWEHRDAVLSVVGNQQTIITAAERESVPKNLLKKAKVVGL